MSIRLTQVASAVPAMIGAEQDGCSGRAGPAADTCAADEFGRTVGASDTGATEHRGSIDRLCLRHVFRGVDEMDDIEPSRIWRRINMSAVDTLERERGTTATNQEHRNEDGSHGENVPPTGEAR